MNLRPLNHFVSKRHFKMETANMLHSLLQSGEWMVTINLLSCLSLLQNSIGSYCASRHCMSSSALGILLRLSRTHSLAPVWPHQPWYPLLLESLVELPLLPPPSSTLLDPFNQPHPLMLSGNLQLTAWKVSRIASLKQVFQTRLWSSSSLGGAVEPMQHTCLPG